MGLCKCSKRRVTNLFCFVHRVNVCEDCLVSQHPRCIVQSYLRWLEDSDYDAVCGLCTKSLLHGEVIRLLCYDLFHLSCLEKYLGANQANHLCPMCKEAIVPPDNLISPVAQMLRSKVQVTKRTSHPVASEQLIITDPSKIRDESLYSLGQKRFEGYYEEKSVKTSRRQWYHRRNILRNLHIIGPLLIIIFIILTYFLLRVLHQTASDKDPLLN